MNDAHYTDAATPPEKKSDISDFYPPPECEADGISQAGFELIVLTHELMRVAMYLHEDLYETLAQEVEFLIRKYR